MKSSPTWQLRLLGAFELSDGSRRITRVTSRAAMLLLARLAMSPDEAHAREVLIDLLWPDADLESGRHRLRQTLSTLRKLLEPPGREGFEVFEADRLAIRLRPNAIACDALQFRAAIASGDAVAARALDRGELLPGIYDEWVHEERQRLLALRDRLPPPDAAMHPAAARARPRSRTPATPPPRHALPSYLTRHIGDGAATARLRAEVCEYRAVVATGPGGIGKTRLAAAVAQSLRADAVADENDGAAFDFCCFVALADCADNDAMLAAIELALQLPAARGTTMQVVQSALAGRRVLLLLDNMEQLADGAEVVASLLDALPQLHVLATSRRPLGLSGERLHAVEPLAVPDEVSHGNTALAQIAANPAVELFVERARAARTDFYLHQGNAADVVNIVRRLDGLPLAIELAAARIRSAPPARMARLLSDAAQSGSGILLWLARSSVAPHDHRQRSMQATIDWSWQLLTLPQREQLAALTVPHGPFSAATAAGVIGCDELEATAIVDELASQSMLRVGPDALGDVRFALPEPVHEFVTATVAAGHLRALRARHRGAWLARARVLPADVPIVALRIDWPDILRSIQAAVDDGAPDDALSLALALRWVIELLRLPASALRALDLALERSSTSALAAATHAMLAPLQLVAGRDHGLRHVECALALAPDHRADVRAEALINEARIRWTVNQRDPRVAPALDEANGLLDGMSVAEAAPLRARWCGIAGLLASSQVALHGDKAASARAQQLHREALAIWQSIGNSHMAARANFDLGVAAYYAHRFDESVERMEAVLAHARACELRVLQSQACQVLGDSLAHLRCWGDALQVLDECISVAWDAHAPLEMAFGFWCLPRPVLRLGHSTAAAQLAGFAEANWRAVVGPPNAGLARLAATARRLIARRLTPLRLELELSRGAALKPAEAVSLVRGLQVHNTID